nr:MAG TPA: hypothetical protein [Bacteriophage sp.]
MITRHIFLLLRGILLYLHNSSMDIRFLSFAFFELH